MNFIVSNGVGTMPFSINKITFCLLAAISTSVIAAPVAPTLPVDQQTYPHSDLGTGVTYKSGEKTAEQAFATNKNVFNTSYQYTATNPGGNPYTAYAHAIIRDGEVSDAILKNSSLIENVTFKGNSFVVITGDDLNSDYPTAASQRNPLSKQITYQDDSIEYVYTMGTSGIKATSINASFLGNSKQIVNENGISNSASFDGTSQYILGNGQANDAIFYNNATQVLSGKAITSNTHFDASQQFLGAGTSSTTTQLTNKSVSRVEANAKHLDYTTLSDSWLILQAADIDGASAERVYSDDNSIITVLTNTDRDAFASIQDLDGHGLVNFEQESGKVLHANLKVDTLANHDLDSKFTFQFNKAVINDKTDFVTINNALGKHQILWQDHDMGREAMQDPDTGVDFLKYTTGDASFRLVEASGREVDEMDLGVFVYKLHEYQDAAGDSIWGIKSTGRLSPATIASLNMAAAPMQIMQNEMKNLRFRMMTLKDSEQNTGVWVRAIGSRSEVDHNVLDFTLKQKGLELGLDHGWRLDSGVLVAGVFGNASSSDVVINHGKTSTIDSYALGGYLSYFADSGMYVDGVLKYNKFDNKLKATSTNGYDIRGDYKTHGAGLALEVGYQHQQANGLWVEPYGRISYNQMFSKKHTLNNGMRVDIASQESVIGELGTSVGQRYEFSSGVVLPYVKVAIARELASGNKVTLNNRYRFNQDLIGNTATVGLGANIALKNNVNVFMEVDRQFGSKVKAPVQGNLGLRYNF